MRLVVQERQKGLAVQPDQRPLRAREPGVMPTGRLRGFREAEPGGFLVTPAVIGHWGTSDVEELRGAWGLKSTFPRPLWGRGSGCKLLSALRGELECEKLRHLLSAEAGPAC